MPEHVARHIQHTAKGFRFGFVHRDDGIRAVCELDFIADFRVALGLAERFAFDL